MYLFCPDQSRLCYKSVYLGRLRETPFRESFDSFCELLIFRIALTYRKLILFSKIAISRK